MKVIIAGGRDILDFNIVHKAIEKANFNITEVVSGKCKGVDILGERWARLNNIPIKPFPADWGKYGKKAGPLRNIEMANYAEALIAIWNGVSRGTGNMIEVARNKNLFVYVYEVK